MPVISVPEDYGYVLAAITSTFLVSTWHASFVMRARKAAKIPYPYEYASYEQVSTASPSSSAAMLAFNAAQRAHQNFNENHPTALGAMLVAGLAWPRAVGVLGGVWAVNRVVYAVGYKGSGEQGGKGRYKGAAGIVAHYVLICMAVVSAWRIVSA